jgi:hypothetical protein
MPQVWSWSSRCNGDAVTLNHAPAATCVTVVAANRETVDGMHMYLQARGVASRTARALHPSAVAQESSAVVLFPDDISSREIIKQVMTLRRARPQLLLVVVTSHASNFVPAFDPDGESETPIVLPKPVFGWTILDAIRDHVGGAEA